MNWIKPDITLGGDFVDLLPMEEKHFDELLVLAQEQRIWEFLPNDMSTIEKHRAYFYRALELKEEGGQFPFVVYHKMEKRIIGSSRYMFIDEKHRKLEIGATWYQPVYWGSIVNLECKLLMLTHCFEELKTIRVWLKTSVENIRSRKAIEKIGAKFEGILRNDMIRDNGTKRNSAYYSIIDDEWEETKAHLQNLINKKVNE